MKSGGRRPQAGGPPRTYRGEEVWQYESTNPTIKYIAIAKSSPCGISSDFANFIPLLTTLLWGGTSRFGKFSEI